MCRGLGVVAVMAVVAIAAAVVVVKAVDDFAEYNRNTCVAPAYK